MRVASNNPNPPAFSCKQLQATKSTATAHGIQLGCRVPVSLVVSFSKALDCGGWIKRIKRRSSAGFFSFWMLCYFFCGTIRSILIMYFNDQVYNWSVDWLMDGWMDGWMDWMMDWFSDATAVDGFRSPFHDPQINSLSWKPWTQFSGCPHRFSKIRKSAAHHSANQTTHCPNVYQKNNS